MPMEQLELIRVWDNEIVTEIGQARSMTVQEIEGHISLLHKGGKTTDKAGDWRPLVLPNWTYSLIMHVLTQDYGIVSSEQTSWNQDKPVGERAGGQT